MRYNFAADSFYIMKLCSRLFVLDCRSRPIWKALAEFLLSVIELLFLCLTIEALQSKMCQNSLPSGVGRSLGAKASSLGNIFWFLQN